MSDLPPVRDTLRQIYQMTWPMLFGVLSLMSFQLVDSAFIGQLGLQPLAVVGFTIPIYQTIIGVQVGLGIATTAVISKAIGAGKEAYAQSVGGLIIAVGGGLMLLLCLLIWFIRHPIMTLLGADPTLFPMADTFWAIWLPSAFSGALLYFGYSICRAHGNTLLPGITMIAASLLNIALDPLYIFVFDLGIAGAAWASLTCFTLGIVFIYWQLVKNQWFEFGQCAVQARHALRELGKIMGPAMLGQFMPSISAILATGIVASYGTTAVAAWGLGIRLEFFSIVIVLAMTMSIPPIVGKLYGAGRFAEINQVIRLSAMFILVWQVVMYVLWLILGPYTSPLMTTDSTVIQLLNQYILFVPASYGALGVCMLVVSACNAIGLPMRGLFVSFARLFLCYLPFVWLGAQWGGFAGIIQGAMVGNLIAGGMAWYAYRQAVAHRCVHGSTERASAAAK